MRQGIPRTFLGESKRKHNEVYEIVTGSGKIYWPESNRKAQWTVFDVYGSKKQEHSL